jgi:hypothetical protein
MARQVGPIFLERTIDDVIFYKIGDEYFVRMKPCFPDIRTSPRFRGTMQSARRLGGASKIGAAIYKSFPAGLKEFRWYRILVGEAVYMLKAGWTKEEAAQLMQSQYNDWIARSEKIASAVYTVMGEGFKREWMYWAFVGEAMEMLKERKTGEEVMQVLWDCYASEFVGGYNEENVFTHSWPVERKIHFVRRSPVAGYRKTVAVAYSKDSIPWACFTRQHKTARFTRNRIRAPGPAPA